ncbi:MAG: NAD(P)-binding protein, partial [Acidobacteriaceae bacterium]|nr:NAD(P)-binding protein [Acidobacteriaceae bacterium]
MSKQVAIVGAGLAGLACALRLKQRGVQARIFEATDRVGGRVTTDEHEGFLL